MPFLLGKNGAIPVAPVNTYIENAVARRSVMVPAKPLLTMMAEHPPRQSAQQPLSAQAPASRCTDQTPRARLTSPSARALRRRAPSPRSPSRPHSRAHRKLFLSATDQRSAWSRLVHDRNNDHLTCSPVLPASTALRRNKQFKEALDYANQAVAVVGRGHDDGSGSNAAYGVRAQAEAELGDLIGASDDLSKAENFERAAIAEMGKTNADLVQHEYVPVLKDQLNFHAQILLGARKDRRLERGGNFHSQLCFVWRHG